MIVALPVTGGIGYFAAEDITAILPNVSNNATSVVYTVSFLDGVSSSMSADEASALWEDALWQLEEEEDSDGEG
jgi:hypothetical protein